jgi:hypothetical protein
MGIKASPTAVLQYGDHGGAIGYFFRNQLEQKLYRVLAKCCGWFIENQNLW